MSDVHFQILTPLPLSRRQDAHGLFRTWADIAPGFFPDRYGSNEPLRREFSLARLDEALKEWEYHYLLKRTAPPKLESNIFMQYGPHRTHSTWKISLKNINEFNQETFQKLLKTSAITFAADFGFIHRLTKIEIERGAQNQSITFLNSAHTRKSLFVTTKMLRRAIPDIYWMTVFGSPYVRLFSRERLLSAPAYRVQELKNGAISIQLTEDVADTAKDELAFEKIRSRVKDHLSCNAFFDEKKPAGNQYEVPEFTWPQLLQ
jgi:hypothetical protein